MRSNKPAILATVCVAVLAINLNTTVVNIALPTLSRELDAGTRELLWFVDGYNLAFAALVLAAGQPVRPVRPPSRADPRPARLRPRQRRVRDWSTRRALSSRPASPPASAPR